MRSFQLSLDKLLLNQIDQEREGEQIDRALLKNVLDIFVEIGMGQMDHYENELLLLTQTLRDKRLLEKRIER